MPGTNDKEYLLGLLQGDPKPLIPKAEEETPRFDKWRRDLYEWFTKQQGRLTATNIVNTIIQAGLASKLAGAGGSGTSYGFGPVKTDIYTDYAWVDGTTPFGGTLVGTIYNPRIHFEHIEYWPGVGRNDGVNAFNPTCLAARTSVKVTPHYTETYHFTSDSDDGIRLYFDGVLKVDEWAGSHSDTFDVSCTANVPITVIFETVNSGGNLFQQRLRWRSVNENGDNQIDIPTSAYSRIP